MFGLLRVLSELFSGIAKLLPVFWVVVFAATALPAQAVDANGCEYADFAVRWGQGGFSDNRAEDNKVGGGQLALDVAGCGSPLVFTISSEYYTKGPVWDAEHNYEISNMYALNLQYTRPLPGFERTDYFLLAGTGRLKVPDRGSKVDSELYNFGVGLHWKRFEHFGFYTLLKYLYAQEDVGGEPIIDFKETILLLGVSYRFSL